VLATGTRPRRFDTADFAIPLELAARVGYEVYPLREMRDRRMVIVGAGDAAFDYALNLSRHNQVIILNRGETTRCLPLLWTRAQREAKIGYHSRTRILHLEADPAGGMQVTCASPQGEFVLQADYLLGAIGRDACLDVLTPALHARRASLGAEGRLQLIGDVANGLYRQTAIAAGQGVLAAMQIYSYLQEKQG
jgi:thioredoxin reductase